MMAEIKEDKVLYVAEVIIKDLEEVKAALSKAEKDLDSKAKEIITLKAAAKTHDLTIKNLNASLSAKPVIPVEDVLDLLKKIRASMGGQFGQDGWDNPADVYKLANKAIELLGSK
jgi:hypothetical protein